MFYLFYLFFFSKILIHLWYQMIFPHVTGTSSVARGLSIYFDELIGNRMSNLFRDIFLIEVDFLAEYPDFFSFVVVMLLAVLLSIGVKESSILNNVFTTINMATVILVIFTGALKCTSH